MQHIIPYILIGAILAFAIYRRARAHIGRQPLRPARLKARIGIFIVVAVVILALAHAPLLPALAGVIAGAVVAVVGLKFTQFEEDGGKVFYTPNIYIGIGVTFLFVARIVARFATQMDAVGAAQVGQRIRPDYASAMASPTTVGVVMLLIGYYVVYYAGILWTARPTNPDAQFPPRASGAEAPRDPGSIGQ